MNKNNNFDYIELLCYHINLSYLNFNFLTRRYFDFEFWLDYRILESFNSRASQILETIFKSSIFKNTEITIHPNSKSLTHLLILQPTTDFPNFPNLKPSNPSPISSNSTVTKSHLTTQTVIQRTNCWRKSIHFLSIPLSPGTSAPRTVRGRVYIYIYISSGVSFQSLNSFTFQATRIFLFRLIRTFHKHNTSDQVSFPIARKTLGPSPPPIDFLLLLLHFLPFIFLPSSSFFLFSPSHSLLPPIIQLISYLTKSTWIFFFFFFFFFLLFFFFTSEPTLIQILLREKFVRHAQLRIIVS